MNAFIQPYINRVLSLNTTDNNKEKEKEKETETFLDALARFTRDPRILRDQLVAVLLAGRDTTAGTLSFCLFELSRNPDTVRRLREEIRSRVGLGPSGRKPSYTDLKEMKFLNAVLNETMRVYPVVPFNVRHALRATTLPRGGGPDGRAPVGVREGTRVIYSTLLLQRDKRHYDTERGLDPALWLPQRWVEGWQPKPWFFIPFNGGPRICIGQQFAMIEMAYTVVRILQAFETVTAVPPAGEDHVRDPTLEFEVTLSPGSELNCVFSPA